MSERIRTAVVGATGYTGAELLRLLSAHPRVEVTRIIGQSRAGEPVAEVLPSMAGLFGGEVAAYDADDVASAAEVAFCALPHGASAGIVSELRDRDMKVFDLSADFRLDDAGVYATWYGEHGAPARFGEAAYGLVELYRDTIREADLVAVPGCFPTAAVLGLGPLLRAGLVDTNGLLVDAKTGASGAGRKPSLGIHLPEVGEGVRAYKAAGLHRHTPEIEQELSKLAGADVRVTFVPHLIPMTRGILATGYAMAKDPTLTAERCTEVATRLYEGSPSVVVLPPGGHPDTAWVRGSNRAFVSYTVDARTGRVLAQCVIDNLVKGAAGQAVQCMNVRMGWPEGEGLGAPATWP